MSTAGSNNSVRLAHVLQQRSFRTYRVRFVTLGSYRTSVPFSKEHPVSCGCGERRFGLLQLHLIAPPSHSYGPTIVVHVFTPSCSFPLLSNRSSLSFFLSLHFSHRQRSLSHASPVSRFTLVIGKRRRDLWKSSGCLFTRSFNDAYDAFWRLPPQTRHS